MVTVKRKSGLEINLPDAMNVVEAGSLGSTGDSLSNSTRGVISLPDGPVPLLPSVPEHTVSHDDAVADIMSTQEMDLLDVFDIDPGNRSKSSRHNRRVNGLAMVSAEIHEHEDAVLLLEQGGVYSWHFYNPDTVVDVPATRKGPIMSPTRKRVVFDIGLAKSDSADTLRKCGPVSDLLLDRTRAFVFKFAARMVVGTTVKFLERNVKHRLVLIDSSDVTTWKQIETLAGLPFPESRSARILLFVHGTFSNTKGSFGALTATEWGRMFLATAVANYDFVFGFDHATLGNDPLENATELLALLESADWRRPPVIDSIAFSRGALVIRSLVEYLLPMSTLGAKVRRTIFVGGTNGGTLLAEPAHWEFLIDLYTNLAVAASRVLQMLAPATAVGTILKESFASLGALVKYMAAAALEERVVPGLASMVPTGDFIGRINEVQQGQPSAFEAFYCVISSEFDLSRRAKKEIGFPAQLFRWLVDAAADRLIGGANDLVVDVISMSHIDPKAGVFVKDKLEFVRNPDIYHTVYFVQREVTQALTKWLELEETPVAAVIPEPVDPLSDMLDQADFSLFVLPANTAFKVVLELIQKDSPRYIVVRQFEDGNPYYFALASDELTLRATEVLKTGTKQTLRAALADTPLELSKSNSSTTLQLAGQMPVGLISSDKRCSIILDGDVPIAVVPRSSGPISSETATAAIGNLESRGNMARAKRSRQSFRGVPATTRPLGKAFQRNDKKVSIPESGAAVLENFPSPGHRSQYYFGASMAETIRVGKTESIRVTVSLDVLESAGDASMNVIASGLVVDPDLGEEVPNNLRLIIQIIPKTNVEVVGEDRFQMAPFTVDRGIELMFDIRGTHQGEGELWVIVRQGATKLATMILKPVITAEHVENVRSASAVANSVPAPPLKERLPVLQIFERKNGNSLGYLFALDMGDGSYFHAESHPFQGDRKEYVTDLYKEIEGRWLNSEYDFTAFSAELREFGGVLCDQLIPPSIQEALWSARDQLRAIHVLSEEPFIPWELVHLKPPPEYGIPQRLPKDLHFLGQKGLIRWLHNYRNAPTGMTVRSDRAYYAIPDYPHPDYRLPAAQAEIPILQKLLNAKAAAPKSREILTLLATPGAVDLFHFAGHGEADPMKAAGARVLLEGHIEGGMYSPDHLRSMQVQQNAEMVESGGNRPLIFLNACQIGRAGWQLTSIGGFAEAFLRAGAGAFIGTLWAVGDEPARAFAETFYRHLRAGNTLAEAAIAAREKARDAEEATWLAYVVYGHPHASVRFI